jgi:uncharacterized membrane protein (DUF485 family)
MMNKIKLSQKFLKILTLALCVFLIVFGVLDAVFKFISDEKLLRDVSNGVIFAILVSYVLFRKARKDDEMENAARNTGIDEEKQPAGSDDVPTGDEKTKPE